MQFAEGTKSSKIADKQEHFQFTLGIYLALGNRSANGKWYEAATKQEEEVREMGEERV